MIQAEYFLGSFQIRINLKIFFYGKGIGKFEPGNGYGH